MKTITLSNTNPSKRIKLRLLVLFVLLVFCSAGVFGQSSSSVNYSQEVVEALQTETATVETQTGIVSLESKIDFMGWFMGTKQNQNSDIAPENTKTTQSTKKQIISAGITPNKVLYRTFIKKVMTKDSAIA
jgi:hypothetical protein